MDGLGDEFILFFSKSKESEFACDEKFLFIGLDQFVDKDSGMYSKLFRRSRIVKNITEQQAILNV